MLILKGGKSSAKDGKIGQTGKEGHDDDPGQSGIDIIKEWQQKHCAERNSGQQHAAYPDSDLAEAP